MENGKKELERCIIADLEDRRSKQQAGKSRKPLKARKGKETYSSQELFFFFFLMFQYSGLSLIFIEV